VKLVVLGGSGSSTPELADALAAWPGGLDRRPALDVILHGRTLDKLEVVAAEFLTRAGKAGPRLAVSVETDRRAALEDADAVLNQVRVGGLDARVFDETFPHEFGLPGEETMGPGGFANAMRTIPYLASTWKDIDEVAPDCLVVNLTNPAGIVHQALSASWPGLSVVTVCDAPEAFARRIAAALDLPLERVLERYIGMNHVGFYVPADPAQLPLLTPLASGFSPAVVEAFGALPTPYVRYYLEPGAQLEAQRSRMPRAQELKSIDAALLAAYSAGPDAERRKRGAVWYDLVVTTILDGWLHGSDRPWIVGAPNEGRVPGAPATTMIEIPHRFAAGALEPLPVPDLPPLVDLWLTRHGAYEKLASEAISAGGPRHALLAAMAANPIVVSFAQADGLLAAIESRSPRN
jgi:6-phospho-beta-glucosidase